MNRRRLILAATSLAAVLAQAPAWGADPSITLAPTQGPSGTVVKVHACDQPGSVPMGFGGNFSLGTVAHVFVGSNPNPIIGPNGVNQQGKTAVAQNVPLVPCGSGLGFGAGTSQPPVSVTISGPPGPMYVELFRIGGDLPAGSPLATFTITGGGSPPQVKPLPDLIVERFGVPGTRTRISGNFIEVFVRVTVKNQGVGAAGIFEVGGFFRDPKETNEWTRGNFVTDGGGRIYLRTTKNLNPGESVILEGWLRLPPSMRGKKPAAFMAQADFCTNPTYCSVEESDETNNESGERRFNLP